MAEPPVAAPAPDLGDPVLDVGRRDHGRRAAGRREDGRSEPSPSPYLRGFLLPPPRQLPLPGIPAAARRGTPSAARAAVAGQVAALRGNAAAGRFLDGETGRAGVAPAAAGETAGGPATRPPGGAPVAPPGRPAAGALGAPSAAADRASPRGAGEAPLHVVTPDAIRARTAAALATLPHPTRPSPFGARPAIENMRDGIEARGLSRAQRAAIAAAGLAGHGPVPAHGPPHEDPGPIPAAMRQIRTTAAHELPPAALPAIPPSPLGTVPDLTGPIVPDIELRAIRGGQAGIEALTTDPAERQRLLDLRERLLHGAVTTTPAPAPDAAGGGPSAPPAPAQLQITDEPVPPVTLDAAQRTLFTRVAGELNRDAHALAVRILTDIRSSHPMYPGRILELQQPDLGTERLVPNLEGSVQAKALELGAAIGLVPDQVQAATAARREELARRAQQASQATSSAAANAQTTAVTAQARTTAAAAGSAEATRAAVERDRAAAHARHPPTAQERAERASAEIRETVATERAHYEAKFRNRQRAIAAAVQRQIAAIRVAEMRDQVSVAPAEGQPAPAIIAQIGRWADAQVDLLAEGPGKPVTGLIDGARAATTGFENELDADGAAAFAALRDWAARQTSAHEAWSVELQAQLDRWATDAGERAKQWQLQHGEEARVALLQDVAAINRLIALQGAENDAARRDFIASLSGESRAVITALADSAQAGSPDQVAALTAGLREQVRDAEHAIVESELQEELLGLTITDGNVEALRTIVHATQPGPELSKRIEAIHTSVTRWRGFDEQAIFTALRGLTPLGAKVLRHDYEESYENLDHALHGYGHVGHLSDDEFVTATDMLRGDPDVAVNGAIGALHSAIAGLGTRKAAIKDILRGLTPEQRQRVLTGYQERYHVSFEADIRDEWISDSQKDEIVALSESHIGDATAIALGRQVETQYTPGDEGGGGGERYAVIDRSAVQEVYAQTRKDVGAEGERRNWTTVQIEAEITLRNQETERAFNHHFAGEWWAQETPQGGSALRTAFNLASGAGRDLLNAAADNDLKALDVARIRLEDQGLYAEDAAINAVFRDQNSRSFAEVNRDFGPLLRERAHRQLAEEERDPTRFPTPAERENRRMELERGTAQELNRMADARTSARMTSLGQAYEAASGRSLNAMVEANMSGASRDEARTRVAKHGVVSNYDRVRFAIDGVGTDMDMLRSALEAMEPKEREDADRQWRLDHGGESLAAGISGDTSGRDEGDMLDLLEYGSPRTVEEAVDAVRRRNTRDREGATLAGEAVTSSELAASQRAISELEADLVQMHRRDLSPDERERISARFDTSLDRANLAIEIQRNAVDAWANLLSNAVALVVAVAVGAAIEFFSGGAATPLVVAVISSLAATAASMATKQLIKGAAYGREEIEADLAIGAADALVSALTAGLGKALMGETLRGATAASRTGMNQTLARMGRLSGAAARAQSRFAGLVSRGPAAGLLARGVERTGLFTGLELASRPWWARAALTGASHVVEQGVQALPSSFVASLVDERVWRTPGGAKQVFDNTLSGAAHSTVMGLGFAAAHASLGHAYTAVREQVPRLRGIFDAGGRLTVPREPAVEAGLPPSPAERQIHEARVELLGQLPEHERGRFADVPILSATDAELERLGRPAGDAHLVVADGQAIVIVREGAPPSAVRPLLGEIEQRVFPESGGLTLEGALPPHLREAVPIRRDPSLPQDEVRINLDPPGDGPIRSIEVAVGPNARPVDVALHADALDRIRRWTGRVGEARVALASLGEHLGFEVESPRDRARFEAAAEVRKLGPIIDERIRRVAEIRDDPNALAQLDVEVRHLLAQQEHARRILAGAVPAEPVGYIAARAAPRVPAEPAAGAPRARRATAEPSVAEAARAVETTEAAEPASHGPPAGDADTRALQRAGELSMEITRLDRFVTKHQQDLRQSEFSIRDVAERLHDRLRGTVSPAELGRRDRFADRFTGSADACDRALADLSRTAGADPGVRAALDRLAELRGKFNVSERYRSMLSDRVAGLNAELASIGDLAVRGRRLNEQLSYERLGLGPDGVCVPPGTPVLTPTGCRPIETLEPGDFVLAADPAGDDEPAPALVLGATSGWTDWLVEIITDRGRLAATRSHRIWTRERGWIPARLIVPGMHLRTVEEDAVAVRAATLIVGESATCNLEVERDHTYFAGFASVLVHNEVREPTRRYDSTTKWTSEIYYVSRLIDGKWEVIYVGSTNAEGLTFARFKEHLAEGRPESRGFKPWKRDWPELWKRGTQIDPNPAGGRWGLGEWTRGELKVEVRERRPLTDLELAIREQAHMNFNDAIRPLVNRIPAIGEDGFAKYWDAAKFAPCP